MPLKKIDLLEPVFRFSDVIASTEITRKSLRSWLDREQFQLISPVDSGKWRKFSASDVAMLAVLNEMKLHGLTIKEAEGLSRSCIPNQHRNAPIEYLNKRWVNRRLILWRDENQNWNNANIDISREQLPLSDAETYIIMNIHEIIEKVIKGLKEISDD